MGKITMFMMAFIMSAGSVFAAEKVIYSQEISNFETLHASLSINKKLGRAWVELMATANSDSMQFDAGYVLVKGLTFNAGTSTVDMDGVPIVSVGRFGHQRNINKGGISVRYTSKNIDDGRTIYKATVAEVVLSY